MKITPARTAVVLILLLVSALAVWSKIRFVDDNAQEPQRWRVEDYPGLKSEAVPKNGNAR